MKDTSNVIELFPQAEKQEQQKLTLQDIEEFETLMMEVICNMQYLDRESLERAYVVSTNFCRTAIKDIYKKLDELEEGV